MPGTMTHEGMRDLLNGADLHGLFLELGWDNPPDTGPVDIKNTEQETDMTPQAVKGRVQRV